MYYERHLPHWQPEGAALFVTWRLHGSLPRGVEPLRVRWIRDERVAQCVAAALHFGEKQLGLYDLRAWVLMVNHVHILIYPAAILSRITNAIKNFAARQANAILDRTGQPFWQEESYDHWVRSPEELEGIVRYIEANPLAADLVRRIEDWRWSSAYPKTSELTNR